MIIHGYTIDPAYVKDGGAAWVTTGNGEYVLGTKGGRKFFIKRNMHVRYPTHDAPKAVYDQYKKEADDLEQKQKSIGNLMGKLSADKDHIVVEEDHFWYEYLFITVTACIQDALPNDADLSDMSLDVFLDLSRQLAEEFEKLHACNVIHGDLKNKNVVVVKKGSAYVPYLIDFDSSYTVKTIPDFESIGGSKGYQSPEVMAYGELGPDEVDPKCITPATDIFSLAVVMHKWWTNRMPIADVESGVIGEAVYFDKGFTIDKKFDVKIGKRNGATLMSLLNWMFAKDPAERPTAGQVVSVLSDKLAVPVKYHLGSDNKPFDTELWEAHKSVATLLPADELRGKGLESLKRINEGRGSESLKYSVTMAGGKEKVMTVLELCEAGYATLIGAKTEEPWPEHMIEFEPSSVIISKGYSGIRKAKLFFKKRYIITTVSGREFDKGQDWLVAEGLAHPKLSTVEADTPWPEHGTSYDFENMSRYDVKEICRIEVGGEHRYRVVYNTIVDGKNKTLDRVPGNNLKLMGFIK